MQGSRSHHQVNPRFVPDNIPVWLGNNKDSALIFDNANAEITLQTKNDAGVLTDRLRIKADAATVTIEFIGNLGVNSVSVGGGVGVIPIGNATTVPTTNPSGGGILYTQAGALKYRGSAGSLSTLALA